MERNWGDWVSEHGLSGKLILNQIVMATEKMFIPHSLCGDFSLQNFVLWLRTWWPLIYRGPLRYLLWSLWGRVLFASNSHPRAEQFTPSKFPGNNNQGLSSKWHRQMIWRFLVKGTRSCCLILFPCFLFINSAENESTPIQRLLEHFLRQLQR